MVVQPRAEVATDHRTVMVADLVAKALLVGLFLAAVLWPDLSGLKGKATSARLVVYPVGALVLPLWWLVAGRLGRRRGGDEPHTFPWHADILVTLPWLLDLLGNRLNLFDSVAWWDDAMHLVNWALLTAGVLTAFAPRRLTRGLSTTLALGFGTTAAVVWELGEYVAFIRHSPELLTAYTDTLGDLTLGSLGALLAGLVVHQVRRAPSGRRPAF
jgi:hypothetical protein